jgi:DNA invertase Pin-like site-specific DNA recombinase
MEKTIKKEYAAIYTRVSTVEQVDGYELDIQQAHCEQYAIACSITVCKVYADEGVSGTKSIEKRPMLSEL